MRINSLGDVSIGTTGGNGRALEVHTANDYIAKFKSTDAYGGIIIEDSASTNNYNRIAVTGNSMSFATNNVTRVMINDSGNVGIGTSSPTRTLDVIGDFGVKKGSSAIAFNEYSKCYNLA